MWCETGCYIGTTWRGGVNRDQIRNGGNIMGWLMSIVIHRMIGNDGGLWGNPCHPVADV
jgi:hypothetical protein